MEAVSTRNFTWKWFMKSMPSGVWCPKTCPRLVSPTDGFMSLKLRSLEIQELWCGKSVSVQHLFFLFRHRYVFLLHCLFSRWVLFFIISSADFNVIIVFLNLFVHVFQLSLYRVCLNYFISSLISSFMIWILL